MKECIVNKLIEMGAKRWTKNSHDRLYLGRVAHAMLGFDAEHQTLKGHKTSNTYTREIVAALDKTYIDLNTDAIVCPMRNTEIDRGLMFAIEDMIEESDAAETKQTEHTVNNKEDAAMKYGFIMSKEEMNIREFIESYWLSLIDIPETYSMEDAEADYQWLNQEWNDVPEGMTVEDVYNEMLRLVENYVALNREE